jgi:hypothetical protein
MRRVRHESAMSSAMEEKVSIQGRQSAESEAKRAR